MSKSDLLGTGASFSNARRTGGRSERGRAKAVAQGDIPSYELLRLPLDQVSPTSLNPRRNFGSDEDMTRFGEELRQAQLSACVVVTRSAYLCLWPDHEGYIGAAAYVLINGERRFRSALHVGLESLDFVVRDDLAASRTDFIDHLLAENLDREDFDVIERARGVRQLVDICAEQGREHGAKSRAAERLGKSPSWVTNQLVLLELPEEIRTMLSSGELPERDGRLLARAAKDRPDLSVEDLLDLLKDNKAQEAQVKAVQREMLREARDSAPVRAPADSRPADDGGEQADSQPRLLSADKSRALDPLPETPGEERITVAQPDVGPVEMTAAPLPQTIRMPEVPLVERAVSPVIEPEGAIPVQAQSAGATLVSWNDPHAVFEAIRQHMPAKQRAELTMMLIDNNGRARSR
ncbi:ParB/RepB/Spo0J family partition protein [Streptomyces lavendulae]|uniref:ParB/RepB/Spo0J family partition protein n=1 Tax=Streptomyces lavendulae TaxID=1914 RepID=UPI00382DD297